MSEEKAVSCCFTGHRTILDNIKHELFSKLEKTLVTLVEEEGIRLFIAGGALGFDTLASLCVLKLRESYPDIKLRLAIPCDNQTRGWNKTDVEAYQKIMAAADEVVYTSHLYTRGCMHVRNRYMVDNSNFCVAYMTKPSGGTAYTVKYALSKNKNVINLGE